MPTVCLRSEMLSVATMGDQSRGRMVRPPREFFNAPRYPRLNHDFYEDAERITVLTRPTSILTKSKEPAQSIENVRILQSNATTSRSVACSSPSSSHVPPPSVLSRPSSTSSLPTKGTQLTILNSSRSEKIPQIARNVSTAQTATSDTIVPHMKAAIRLIGDNMEFTDYVEEYLSDSNTNFTVIGAVGPQGTGKSTLLSMIAGNDHQDMYRHYAFRPASREAVESCRHQSSKISIYVSKSRLILLDCQASFSTAILDELIRNGRRGFQPKVADFCDSRVENHVEIESIQLISFMMQVCHTILLCVDWFIDLDVVRLVRASEMLRTVPIWTSDKFKFKPNRTVNLVLVHQRAKSEDFEPDILRYRCDMLKGMFAESKLNVEGLLNLGAMGHDVHKGGSININYVLLADMKPRMKLDVAQTSNSLTQQSEGLHLHSPVIDYEFVLRTLRIDIQRLPKDSFTVGESYLTEKRWYSLASKLWRSTFTSQDVTKFSSILSSVV
uniref:Protein SMG9 n=5 Tax=Parascaris TaxID=6254 RepID=A0A915AJP4_PARUN